MSPFYYKRFCYILLARYRSPKKKETLSKAVCIYVPIYKLSRVYVYVYVCERGEVMQLDGRRTGLGRTRYFFSCRFITYIQKSQKLSVVTLCVDATRLKHPLAVPYMYHPFSFGFTRIVEALLNMCFPRETSTINFLHLFDKASQRTNDGCICIRIYRYSIESFFCRLSAPYEDIPITLSKGPYTLTLIRNRYHKD